MYMVYCRTIATVESKDTRHEFSFVNSLSSNYLQRTLGYKSIEF